MISRCNSRRPDAISCFLKTPLNHAISFRYRLDELPGHATHGMFDSPLSWGCPLTGASQTPSLFMVWGEANGCRLLASGFLDIIRERRGPLSAPALRLGIW